jgi:uracil phosphoribosyltransferase
MDWSARSSSAGKRLSAGAPFLFRTTGSRLAINSLLPAAAPLQATPEQEQKASPNQSEGSAAMPVHIVNHPVITHKISTLRDKNTPMREFRRTVAEITLLLAYEATRDLGTVTKPIETPLCPMDATVLAQTDFVIVPILRAGLGMVEGLLHVLPEARVGHIGLRRDEKTALPSRYYYNIPDNLEQSTVLALDPMLATAGSLSEALTLIKRSRPANIRAVCLIAAPEGRARIERDHPDVQVFVGAVDDHLDERAFIVPGLGDAGDRMFGTL